jgi:hypothetical protein
MDNVTKFGRKLFNSSLISILPKFSIKLEFPLKILNYGETLRTFGFFDVPKESDCVYSAEFRTRFGLGCCHTERLAQTILDADRDRMSHELSVRTGEES